MAGLPPEPVSTVITQGGIRIKPPTTAKPYWRLDYWEDGARRQPSAGASWAEAYAKAAPVEARLLAGTGSKPTQPAIDWLDWWLTPGRQPRTVSGLEKKPWGLSHRDSYRRLVDLHLRPQVVGLVCEQVTSHVLQRAIDHAKAVSTPDEARRVLAMIRQAVREGHQHGWIALPADVLLARLSAPIRTVRHRQGETALRIHEDAVPDDAAIALAAAAMALVPKAPWWFELMPQLAAVTGLRLGELLDLDPDDVLAGRRLRVDSQVLERRGFRGCSLPKGDKIRETVFRASGPGGYDVQEALARRIAEALTEDTFTCCDEHGPRRLLFPAPRGGWWSQSNLRQRVWTPARDMAGWERGLSVTRGDDGNVVRDPFVWPWHSLRHHAATEWLRLGATAQEVSTALGHANVRITLEMYVGSSKGLLDSLAAVG